VSDRSGEQPRFLHRDPARNYTHNPGHAAFGEPEPVEDAVLERYARAARRQQEARLRAAWVEAHMGIMGAVESFKTTASGIADRRVLSDVRVIERGVVRVGKRLGLHE
jgi:hypothetical protein